jgi:hypothetical protein
MNTKPEMTDSPNNPIRRLRELALYVEGMGNGRNDDKLINAAVWLNNAADNICSQGYFGCEAGERCTSDHK